MAIDDVKHVFISYVREDSDRVDRLCRQLEAAQLPYWRDKTSLGPGDQWKQAVKQAIQSESLVFLACFSSRSIAKDKSYMNEELTLAIEEFRKLALGKTWIVPVRFDDVELPSWDLGANRDLRGIQSADLFDDGDSTETIKLISRIARIMNQAAPDPAMVRASVNDAADRDRVNLLRSLTKEMIHDSTRRIELADLITAEARHVISAIGNPDKFPVQQLSGTNEDRALTCIEFVNRYYQLAAPFCASLHVAARWADVATLQPWISGLRSMVAEANKPVSGLTVLIELRHLPALMGTFTAGFAASSVGQWANLKALIVDSKVPLSSSGELVAVIDHETPWSPFGDFNELLPQLIAEVAVSGDNPDDVVKRMTTSPVSRIMPIAEWLNLTMWSIFKDQFVDKDEYDRAFDTAEVVLGLISQNLADARQKAEPRGIAGSSRWFGRSLRRYNRSGSRPLDSLNADFEHQGADWPPLKVGLFDGSREVAEETFTRYREDFLRAASSRF